MIERYTLPEAGKIWTDDARYKYWLQVELAACQAMAKNKIIPNASYQRLRKKAKVSAKRVLEIEAEVKHDVIAFTMAVEEHVGKDAQFFHYGLTSSDVLDTAFALQLVDATDLILKEVKILMASLKKITKQNKDLPSIGRSHGIHAEPLAFGQRFLSFYAEVERNYERLKIAREEIAYGQASGAVGAYGTLPPKVEADMCKILKLKPEKVSTQVIPRDRHAQLFLAFALLGAAIERISVEMRHLQRTEVREVEEGFSKGQKGSSAMPHKKNPISGENLTGCARLLRAWANSSIENIALWHERDISHSSVERVIAPDSCILMHYMVVRCRKLIDNLKVNRSQVKANLHATRGLVWSGAVLLAFVEAGLSRDESYRLVQKHALKAWKGGEDLEARLKSDPDVLEYLSKADIKKVFSADRGLKYTNEIYRRVLGRS